MAPDAAAPPCVRMRGPPLVEPGMCSRRLTGECGGQCRPRACVSSHGRWPRGAHADVRRCTLVRRTPVSSRAAAPRGGQRCARAVSSSGGSRRPVRPVDRSQPRRSRCSSVMGHPFQSPSRDLRFAIDAFDTVDPPAEDPRELTVGWVVDVRRSPHPRSHRSARCSRRRCPAGRPGPGTRERAPPVRR